MTRQTDTCTPTRNSVGLPLENGALEAEGISSAPDALPLRGSPALRSRGNGRERLGRGLAFSRPG
jgi:hypothetical protein